MNPLERASDADRERVADLLREGCGQGYLSPETFSERVENAYRARHRTQLEALVAAGARLCPSPLDPGRLTALVEEAAPEGERLPRRGGAGRRVLREG